VNDNNARQQPKVDATFHMLVRRLASLKHDQTGVIPWSSPVPAFGDPSRAVVATLGLNPSNREFVDVDGTELSGDRRRFHTLSSLGLQRWADASAHHVHQIAEYCRHYFRRNPYDTWFRQLDAVISGTGYSYYEQRSHACHLDLVPFATQSKWTGLTSAQRAALLAIAGNTLALLLRESSVRLLILNGASVVHMFRIIADAILLEQRMSSWALRRGGSPKVAGIAYSGAMQELSGIALGRTITILGFNHNLQSSFGVTKEIRRSIAQWISREATDVMAS